MLENCVAVLCSTIVMPLSLVQLLQMQLLQIFFHKMEAYLSQCCPPAPSIIAVLLQYRSYTLLSFYIAFPCVSLSVLRLKRFRFRSPTFLSLVGADPLSCSFLPFYLYAFRNSSGILVGLVGCCKICSWFEFAFELYLVSEEFPDPLMKIFALSN